MVLAGITATLAGGITGNASRPFPGSYFLVSGIGILISCPFVILMLHTPFPDGVAGHLCGVFFLFFNTGPSNTILANVTLPSIRSTAFAVNILVIHALGDAVSPPILRDVGPANRWNLRILRRSSHDGVGGGVLAVGDEISQTRHRPRGEQQIVIPMTERPRCDSFFLADSHALRHSFSILPKSFRP